MSFPNFGEAGAQPQQGGEEQGGYEQAQYEQGQYEQGGYGAPGAQQQPNPMAQQMDPSQQPGQFVGGPQGGPAGQVPQPGGDSKTTLW